MNSIIAALLAVILAVFATTGMHHNASAQTLIDQRAAASQPAAKPRAAPSPWRHTAAYINQQQQKFYRALAKSIRALREERSLAAAYSLILLSFLYGVFHAAGPGHGKMVISAYLLANERMVRKGVLLAFLSSFIQAISAITLVAVAVWLISATGRSTQSFVGTLEQASYALIALVGLVMLWRAVKGHHSHDHDHTHDDNRDHDNAGHDHNHIPTPEQIGKMRNWKEAAAIVFSVGVRPCSGAVLVLLFANTLGLIAAGIGATFAMALGTALTVSALAILTLVSKQTALRLFGKSSRWAARAYRFLSIFGALAIFLTGAILFWGAISAPPRPFI